MPADIQTMEHPLVRWMGDAVLGVDKRQRVRMTQVLLTALLDAILAGIAAYGVWAGLLVGPHVALWATFTLVGVLGFYILVRSGFNLRFSTDPALTLAQGVFSVFSTVAAYVMAGPVRGASLLALAVTLIFGMFALRPRQVRGLSLFAVAWLGATMWWCHHRWPERFPVHEEILHFMLVAVLLPSIAMLAGQLSKMRHKLVQHRAELQLALERNHQLAIHDELTGLFNRRHLLEVMQQEAHRAERNGRSLCVALFDIDHFKRINDEHGHAQGDQVLRSFARTASEFLRESDTLGRWGGEEFMVMLPETTADNAVSVIERVRQQLATVRFNDLDPGMRLTFSAGVAVCGPGETLAATIERADQAMYAAKQSGRDRSVVAPLHAIAHASPVASRLQAVPSSAP